MLIAYIAERAWDLCSERINEDVERRSIECQVRAVDLIPPSREMERKQRDFPQTAGVWEELSGESCAELLSMFGKQSFRACSKSFWEEAYLFAVVESKGQLS